IGLAASAAPCGAVTIRGTSSTAAYVQEASSEPFGTDLENRTRVFERLRFDVLELGAPELTFHGFLTARNDVTNQSIGDTRTRLYHGFLQYRTIPASGESTLRYDLRLGRVWVPAGIGTGTVDGAYARIERPGWGTLAIFGGTLGADAREQWRFDEPDESARIGGELRLRPNLATSFSPEVGVSYALTRRHDEDENSRIGAKATLWVQRQLRIWTEFRHDFLLDETYGQAAGVEYLNRNNGLRLWGEYNRRTPQLPATSFFAFWDTREVSELRGGGGINLFGPYRISADFLRTDFRRPHVGDGLSSGSDVDRAKSIRLVLGRGAYQIGARFESGFGGDRT
ncbi:MAG: hypothetical protein QUU85_00905, partial [Candidatus Eisenbacteria bacterium]|nr:hypothetical protein [Candidatus Eisenbacteria bacterium]